MPSVAEAMREWLNAGLAWFYPECCQLCNEARATPTAGYVCAGCKDRVRLIEPPFCDRCGLPREGAITNRFECSNCQDTELYFSTARSAVAARDPLLEAIHRYKYQRAFWF